MPEIDIATLDKSLISDIGGQSGYTAHKFAFDGAVVSNQCWHVAHSAVDQRGGIVFVGSGSNGQTFWTDAATPDEVLRRYLADDMVA